MDFLIFPGIICFAVILCVSYKVAKLFEKIAFDKGYNKDAHAFAMCFWLGFVGYIYVAAMPKLTSETLKKNAEQHSPTDVETNDFDKANEIYDKANQKMLEGNQNNSIESYVEAIDLFKTIPLHKNTTNLVAFCESRIQELKK